MRTSGRLLLTAALLLCTACSTDDAEVPPAGLAETYDLVIANDLVFVTSAETNDLRVIRPADTDYVRAPNPLEALSIPVVSRPDKLARDVSYNAPDTDPNDEVGPGDEVTGPYVYVRSASESLISVVSTSSLSEVARIRATGAVTALAARGPTLGTGDAADESRSELYFTTQEQGRSRLFRVRIPTAPDALPPKTVLEGEPLAFVASTEAPPAGQPAVVVPEQGYGPVAALAVLPGNQLAMATREFRGTNPAGTPPLRPFANVLLRVDPTQATVLRPLKFRIPTTSDPSLEARREVPVRALQTHGLIRRSEDPADVRAAGDRIFALIDESACTDLRRCGGVLAVQSATGEVALVRTVNEVRNDAGIITQPAVDFPMLPLSFDDSLPTGFTLAPGATLRFTEGTIDVTRKQIHVGVVAHASGQYFFFDAERLVHYDRNAAIPEARFDGMFTAFGAVKGGNPVTNNPVRVNVREGYAEVETLAVIFEGLVTTNFFGIPDTKVLAVPQGVEVLPGDVVLFYASAAGATVCLENGTAVEAQVASVTNNTLTLAGDGSIPAACASSLYFQVLAGGGSVKPWVVYDGTVFLGRVGQGTNNALALSAPPRFLAPGFTPGPRLTVELLSAPVPVTNRGDRYIYAVNPAFDPFNFTVATEIPRLERYFIPGSLIFSPGVLEEIPGEPEPVPVGDNRIYVVYPTADGVLQIALELVRNGSREAVPVVPFQ